MPDANYLTEAGDAIRGASARTETTFLHVGRTLEASIEIITRLTASFNTLLAELKGEDLGRALGALARAAARVAEFGNSRSDETAGFDRLQRITESIASRIMKMDSAVGTVDSLAVSSKIAATDIRSSAIDFSTFADEITRTLQMTRISLDSFGQELQPIRDRVATARAGHLTFEKRQHEAAQSIPPRLRATVTSIHLQHQQASRAGAAVKATGDRVREQICSAVMALQIGDVTRQRLEHADCALALVNTTNPHAAQTLQPARAAHAGLDEDDQYVFTTTLYRLQSAQLLDTAHGFDRDVRQITSSLNKLAAEARAMRNLGSSAFGSSDHGRGTFIEVLEAQVDEALQLLTGFGTAQAEAARVVTSVSDATEGLCGHLARVQSLEADIRIMSLNTTLKCSRVGREGIALSHIAQELRSYATEFAKEASALMAEVETVTTITGSLTGGKDAHAAPVIAEVMQAMQDSLATLRQVGQTLAGALADLERDSDRVVALLEETVANLASHDEIGHALRQAAINLAAMSPRQTSSFANLTPPVAHLLDLLANDYTMANERLVHDRVLGRASPVPATQTAIVPLELEDVLF